MKGQKHWIVFGAKDKGDKSLIAYYDKRASMYAVKVLQQHDDCLHDFGRVGDTDYSTLQREIEGEYITLYFSPKNGVKSIDSFIDILGQVKRWMTKEELKHGNSNQD